MLGIIGHQKEIFIQHIEGFDRKAEVLFRRAIYNKESTNKNDGFFLDNACFKSAIKSRVELALMKVL